MALSASTVWEVRSTGANTAGGGFNVSNANFATDLAATVATGSAPVVTSASYTFVAGDVGAWLFVKTGTNWIPGWYPIASVAAGAATLTASIGSAQLYGGATILNTVAGCATTASPTAGTWSIDYSQQASARLSWTDMVIGATTTQFTSAGNPVTKAMTGNVIQVTSGTGFTVGWYEIVSTATTTATCDRSLGTTASTGGHGGLGGALDGLVTVSSAYVTSNKIFTPGGLTQTTTPTFSTSSGNPTNTIPPTRIIGYSSYRGDGGKATITLSTNTGLSGIHITGNGFWIENLTIDCASLGSSIGMQIGSSFNTIHNCLVKNFTSNAINIANANCEVYGCEITGGTSAANAGMWVNANELFYYYNNVHDNACPGFFVNSGTATVIVNNLITNNTGASSDGISLQSLQLSVLHNTVYGNGRHGITSTSGNTLIATIIKNNLLASNGGYGIKFHSSAGTPADSAWDGNAYYNNTSGTRNNMDDTGTTNPINGVAPYVNTLDIILTANPFVNAAANNYNLNTTAGGGAACNGFGVPTSWPGNASTTSAPSMGAQQPPSVTAPISMMLCLP